MQIEILGCESFGARSLACVVKMDERTILIDPGVALARLRSGLLPHPLEVAAAFRIRENILSAFGQATDVVISHFHGDHMPMRAEDPYQLPMEALPSPDGINFWCKGPEKISGLSSKRRRELSDFLGFSLPTSEGRKSGSMDFSSPVPHGAKEKGFGTVMMTRICEGDEVFIHASDIQLLDREAVLKVGVTDAILLIQNGFPVLSPVTTSFAKHDNELLINLCKKLDMVYICNDNEKSGAGEKGALKTAKILSEAGIKVKIITLPMMRGSEKIDVAEFFINHNKNDFLQLMEESEDLIMYLLNKIKKSTKKRENIDIAKKFIDKIKGFPDLDIAINYDIKDYFDFTQKDLLYIKKKDTSFNLDNVSGRNEIYRAFADEYLKDHQIKCINGKLRTYQAGVYPDSEEDIHAIEHEIMKIGLKHNVNLADNNINAILKLIEHSCRVRINDCEPNKDAVIVCNNGILNLKTFKLEEFSPEKIYFSKLPIDYKTDAPIPEIFIKYLNSTFAGNESQLNLLQEMFGYLLIKSYKYQVYFYLLGPGGNGKGVALSLIRFLFGEENISSASLFQLSDHSQVDYHVAKLHGKYANLCGDIGCKRIENTETLKKLTSNTDLITARNVREKPFEFINYAKMVFAMNRLPKTDAFTTGDKRRICIIDFKNSISDTSKEIKNLQNVIKDNGEMSGILNWAIEGLKRLEANGKFSDSRSVAKKGFEYERKSNPVRYFVEECLFESPGSRSCP